MQAIQRVEGAGFSAESVQFEIGSRMGQRTQEVENVTRDASRTVTRVQAQQLGIQRDPLAGRSHAAIIAE